MNRNAHIYFEKNQNKVAICHCPHIRSLFENERERNSVDVEVNKMDSYYR